MKTFPIAWKIINLQINQSMVKFFSMFDFLICFMMTLKFYCYGLSVLEIVHLSAKSPEAVKENTKEETQKSWAVMSSVQFSSVAQSCPTPCNPMDCSTPGLPSITNSGVYSNPCPLSRWCHPTISSSVIPFSSCPQSFPTWGSSQISQLFASGGQSIGVSASTSVLPMNTQDWSPLGWTGWISLLSKGSQESSPTPQFKSINSSALSFLYSPTLTSIHDHWKNHSLD